MVKHIFDFEIVVDFRRTKPFYTVYVTGQHDLHIMDWRGGNYRRIKLPWQPARQTFQDAEQLIKAIKAEQDRMDQASKQGPLMVNGQAMGRYGKGYYSIEGVGTLVPPYGDDVFDKRVVEHQLSQEEFEELKAEYRELKREK